MPLSHSATADTCLDAPAIDYSAISAAEVFKTPYTYLIARNVLPRDLIPALKRDFPDFKQPGFLPIDRLQPTGSFKRLIEDIEGPEMRAVLGARLGVDLSDKPPITTVRKWSAVKDGRIHNDGEAKIVTALIYLNEAWPEGEDGGRFRILRSDKSFEDCAAEVPPVFGNLVAFVRDDHSWHGHKPFAGERRVVQTAWLRSHADLERKLKRGHFSLFLKNLLKPGQKTDY